MTCSLPPLHPPTHAHTDLVSFLALSKPSSATSPPPGAVHLVLLWQPPAPPLLPLSLQPLTQVPSAPTLLAQMTLQGPSAN